MSNVESEGASAPIKPLYWSDDTATAVGLYSGRMQLRGTDPAVDVTGVVELNWLPSPDVWCRYWNDGVAANIVSHILNTGEMSGGDFQPQDLLDLDGMPSGQVVNPPATPADARFWGESRVQPMEVGAAIKLNRIAMNIINFFGRLAQNMRPSISREP